jgi:hypothetical protein
LEYIPFMQNSTTTWTKTRGRFPHALAGGSLQTDPAPVLSLVLVASDWTLSWRFRPTTVQELPSCKSANSPLEAGASSSLRKDINQINTAIRLSQVDQVTAMDYGHVASYRVNASMMRL